MLRRFSAALALCLLPIAGSVQALGLGDIQVSSALNQRFVASIPFTSLTQDEAANVRARIAENEAFDRAGIERAGYLSSIQVETVTDGPNPRIELRGRELAREPLLNLLVEVRTPGGPRILRQYTVLLDPPVSAAPAAAAPAAAAPSEFFQTPEESAGTTATAAAEPAAPAAPAPPRERPPAVGPGGTYGPVRSGETLWTVAQAVKPAGVGLDQAMLALYENNRSAFNGGDIDSLRRGSSLTVPSVEQMKAVSNAVARQQVLGYASEGGQTDAPAVTAEQPDVAAQAPATSTAGDSGTDGDTTSATLTDPVATAPVASGTDVEESAGSETALSPAAGDAAPSAADPASADADAAAAATATDSEEIVAEESVTVVDEPVAAQGDWISKFLLPALIALILVLIGIAAWRTARERKAQKEYEEATHAAGPAPRPGARKVQASSSSARDELEALDRQIDEDATRIAAADDDATRVAPNAEQARMVTTSRIPAYQGPQAADRPMTADELAVTSQFQTSTKEINLGDNDPLSEAEFHLAYGLYDEAALLLQQASAREPGRTDLRTKLAETYFAAGKITEFEQTASTLKDEVSADEWNKLAIMGRQMLPGSALFAGAGGSDSTVLDFSFDDDATQIAPVKVDEGLEFNLEELELPTQTAGQAVSPNNTLEFDLGEFDLGGSDKPKKAAAPGALDLKDFDLGGSNLAGPGHNDLDVKLADLDPMVIDDPLSDEALSAGDDAATKLDLARAYVEMGDAEMARSLLEEVARLGNDDQKREAGELRSRLLG